MKERFLVVAEDRQVASRFARQLLRLSIALQRKPIEMTLSRIRSAAHDDGPIGFVHVQQLLQLKISRRDGAHEDAIGGTELDLPRAVAFRGPEELPTIFEPDRHRLLIEIQPCSVVFPEKLAGPAGGRIDRE